MGSLGVTCNCKGTCLDYKDTDPDRADSCNSCRWFPGTIRYSCQSAHRGPRPTSCGNVGNLPSRSQCLCLAGRLSPLPQFTPVALADPNGQPSFIPWIVIATRICAHAIIVPLPSLKLLLKTEIHKGKVIHGQFSRAHVRSSYRISRAI
jgi:hypothetical protein